MTKSNNPAPQTIGFARLLDILGHGTDPDDHTSVNSKHVDERFKTVVRPSRQIVAGAKLDIEWPGETDHWFGVNPLVPPAQFARKSLAGAKTGRGAESDVARLAALYADLDVKTGGLDDDSIDAVVDSLAGMLGEPAVFVDTGGGLHVYWPIEGEIKGRAAKSLLRRFGRLVSTVAAKHGGKVDSVFDLARVLRIPGSANWKTGEPRPIVATESPDWYALTPDAVDDALEAAGIRELDGDDELNGGPIVSAPAEWDWAEETCPYVRAVLDEWPTDDPIGGERHRTIMAKATRLAAFWRAGCITAGDYDGGVELLRDWLEEHRPEEPGEVAAAVAWGVEHIATRSDDAIAGELGHDPAHPEGRERALPDLIFPGSKRPKMQVVKSGPVTVVEESFLGPDARGGKYLAGADPKDRRSWIDLGDADDPDDDQEQAWDPNDPRWKRYDDGQDWEDAEFERQLAEIDAAPPIDLPLDPAEDPTLLEELAVMPIDLEDLADPEEDAEPAPMPCEAEVCNCHEITSLDAAPPIDLAPADDPVAVGQLRRWVVDTATAFIDQLDVGQLRALDGFLSSLQRPGGLITAGKIISGSTVVDWKDPELPTLAGRLEGPGKARLEIHPDGSSSLFNVVGEKVFPVDDLQLADAGGFGRKPDGSPITGWSDMQQPRSSETFKNRDVLTAAAERSANDSPVSPRTETTGEGYEPGSSPVWHLFSLATRLKIANPALTRCDRCGGKLTPIGRSKILADCFSCYGD